jgi:hypothetical protein
MQFIIVGVKLKDLQVCFNLYYSIANIKVNLQS